MDALEAIFTRRSVRGFTDKPVSGDEITTMLRAGMQAPSANNQQPWHFIVIHNRELLDGIMEFHPHAKMLKEAQLAIIVCSQVDPEKKWEMWVQDCSAATQNILLAIHALSLGAVWLGVHPREERINGVKQLFNLPGDAHPFSIIAIGHPRVSPEPVDRFDESRIHVNKW